MANQKQRDEATKFDFNAPANYDEAKEQYETALAKAMKNPQNRKIQPTATPQYMNRGGIPHKLKEGVWVPLTKIN